MPARLPASRPAALFVSVLVCGLAAGLSPSAQAQSSRVAVYRFEVEGRLPEVARLAISQRLIEGLAAAGFEVSAGDVLKNVLRKEAGSECRTDTCLRDAAAALGVDYLVTARVDVKQRNYDLRLELVNGRQGKALGSAADRCDLCGVEEVGEKLGTMAASLGKFRNVGAVDLARYTVESGTPDATVAVDGTPVGLAPRVLELPPGRHEIALSAPGHRAAGKIVDVQPGREALLSIDLAPATLAAAAAAARSDGFPWRRYGWASMGLGALLAGGGAIALAFNDQPKTCSAAVLAKTRMMSEALRPRCTHNTEIPAAALFAAGGAAILSGGLIVYITREADEVGAPSAQRPSAWALSAVGRF